MQPNADDLVRIVRHHPAPAVSVEEVRELLAESSPKVEPLDPEAIATLSAQDPQLRLLAPTTRRWAGAGPQCWILMRRTEASPEGRTIEGRLRASLRLLGESLEPGSIRALARWERLLREERKVRRALRRRLRNRARASDPSAPVKPR